MSEPRIAMKQAFYDEFGVEVTDKVQDFVREHIFAERERCARICEEMGEHWSAYKDTALLNGDVELSNAASGEPRAAESLARLIRSAAPLTDRQIDVLLDEFGDEDVMRGFTAEEKRQRVRCVLQVLDRSWVDHAKAEWAKTRIELRKPVDGAHGVKGGE